MNDRKNFKIDIDKGYYNKTYSKDGVNYLVADKEYPYYIVQLTKMYKDVDNKEDLKKAIKRDLTEIIEALDTEKQNEKCDKEKEREDKEHE